LIASLSLLLQAPTASLDCGFIYQTERLCSPMTIPSDLR
jgi:hypothetical protein